MGLKAVLDTIEGVDDALKPLYKAGEGGKYVLDVDDYDAHPSVRALKNAFETQKGANAEIKTRLTAADAKLAELPEDFDAAKWLEWKAGAEKTKGEKDREVANLTQLHEARVAAMKAEYEGKLQESVTAISHRDDMIDRNVRDTELTNLLVKHHIKEELLDGARLLIGSKIKTNRGDDGGRTNVVPTNIGDLPLSDFVKSWAETDGKPYIAPATGPGATGGGRTGGGARMTRAEFEKLTPQAASDAAGKAAKGELQITD